MNRRAWWTPTVALVFLMAGAVQGLQETESNRQPDPGQPASDDGAGDPQTGQADDLPTYRIDPVHSSAIFAVQHFGAGLFYGRFNDVQGTIRYIDDSESDLFFEVVIAIDSVDTDSAKLDGHLKSPDFFDAQKFPEMTFKSHSAKKVGEHNYEVRGELTLHGVTRPLTAIVEWTGTADSRRGKRCGFHSSFKLMRSDFGMTYGLEGGALGDETRVIVSFEAGQAGPDRPQGGMPGRFAELDTNGDGKIQKDEAPERMKEMFDRMDTNQDGALDIEELRAMRRRGNRGGTGGGNDR